MCSVIASCYLLSVSINFFAFLNCNLKLYSETLQRFFKNFYFMEIIFLHEISDPKSQFNCVLSVQNWSFLCLGRSRSFLVTAKYGNIIILCYEFLDLRIYKFLHTSAQLAKIQCHSVIKDATLITLFSFLQITNLFSKISTMFPAV